jgi:hypothetical protein
VEAVVRDAVIRTDVQRDEDGPRSKKVDKRVASALPLQASSCIDPHNLDGGGGWLGDGGGEMAAERSGLEGEAAAAERVSGCEGVGFRAPPHQPRNVCVVA